jgi:hypothetical protein
MEFVKIKNHAEAVKTVFDPQGNQHFIPARSVATLRPDLADLFERTHPECRKVVVGGIQKDAKVIQNENIWIANMTGNPEAPKKVTVKHYDAKTKRWLPTEIPNPLAEPCEVIRSMGGGMKEYIDKAGNVMARNLAPTKYVIDPFQRIEVPKNVGQWMLNRNASSTGKGSILRSRAPTELDSAIHGWPIEKIEALVKYVDPMCRKVANTREKMLSVYKGKNKLSDQELELKLFNEKEAWVKRAHFRLADPKYDLPTLFVFEQWYASRGKEEAKEEESA